LKKVLGGGQNLQWTDPSLDSEQWPDRRYGHALG
jgi:hypothetical protein